MRTALRALPLAAVAVVFALTACAPTKAPPPAPAPPSLPFDSADPIAKELLSLTNSDRAASGLDPLAWNDQLGGLAQNWSNWMAGSGNSTHQNLDAILQDPAWGGFNGLGENIIRGGCGTSAGQMHQAWMSSDLHRANIHGNFSVVGIGVACSGGNVYATEDFGR
jgi:uncharacterized protein YkwD